MASIYRKKGSDKIYLRYKDSAGKWKGKPTSYRWSNFGEVRQAKLLAGRQSQREALAAPNGSERLATWVPQWLDGRYGSALNTTPAVYARGWKRLAQYCETRGIVSAQQVQRDFIEGYLAWRLESAGRNQAISEIKLMAMILREAGARGQVLTNPLARPGLKKAPTKPKEIWSDEQLETAAKHFEKHGSHWMQCVFYMGIYQACRLRMCQVPLDAIRLDLGLIRYPDEIVKGGHGFAQPIDPVFLPKLRDLVNEARRLGLTRLCEVPWDASIRLRRSLDRAGLEGVSHHGLRKTWITRAADHAVAESQAMAFCHHESREVHRIYKMLSAVGIAHVPAAVQLPRLGAAGAAKGSQRATRGNARVSSPSRTRIRIHA